jgi:3-dehydroquinate synthase
MTMQTLKVDLGDRGYPIFIGDNLLGQADFIRPYIKGQQVLVVSNSTVAPLYLDRLRTSLAGLQYSEVILPDGEQHKSLAVLSTIYDQLLSDRHNRTTTLVALGGGVVGDMTGFAAASYQRGVDFIQVPTTLLSQVDSSVGGKTGVNHPLGKNMIGAFHQPNCVIADTALLDTLPDRELAAGLAEVIKYGLICDPGFYQWLLVNAEGLVARDQALLSEAIYRSCENKAKVVASDERESGIRAILNLGHTFGHAIETAQGYGNWLHGEAVATGMLLAADLSERMGWISAAEVATLRALLEQVHLPVSPPRISVEQFLALMAVDKKVLDGQLRLVLLKSIGEAVVSKDVPADKLRDCLLAAAVD